MLNQVLLRQTNVHVCSADSSFSSLNLDRLLLSSLLSVVTVPSPCRLRSGCTPLCRCPVKSSTGHVKNLWHQWLSWALYSGPAHLRWIIKENSFHSSKLNKRSPERGWGRFFLPWSKCTDVSVHCTKQHIQRLARVSSVEQINILYCLIQTGGQRKCVRLFSVIIKLRNVPISYLMLWMSWHGCTEYDVIRC